MEGAIARMIREGNHASPVRVFGAQPHRSQDRLREPMAGLGAGPSALALVGARRIGVTQTREAVTTEAWMSASGRPGSERTRTCRAARPFALEPTNVAPADETLSTDSSEFDPPDARRVWNPRAANLVRAVRDLTR